MLENEVIEVEIRKLIKNRLKDIFLKEQKLRVVEMLKPFKDKRINQYKKINSYFEEVLEKDPHIKKVSFQKGEEGYGVKRIYYTLYIHFKNKDFDLTLNYEEQSLKLYVEDTHFTKEVFEYMKRVVGKIKPKLIYSELKEQFEETLKKVEEVNMILKDTNFNIGGYDYSNPQYSLNSDDRRTQLIIKDKMEKWGVR